MNKVLSRLAWSTSEFVLVIHLLCQFTPKIAFFFNFLKLNFLASSFPRMCFLFEIKLKSKSMWKHNMPRLNPLYVLQVPGVNASKPSQILVNNIPLRHRFWQSCKPTKPPSLSELNSQSQVQSQSQSLAQPEPTTAAALSNSISSTTPSMSADSHSESSASSQPTTAHRQLRAQQRNEQISQQTVTGLQSKHQQQIQPQGASSDFFHHY